MFTKVIATLFTAVMTVSALAPSALAQGTTTHRMEFEVTDFSWDVEGIGPTLRVTNGKMLVTTAVTTNSSATTVSVLTVPENITVVDGNGTPYTVLPDAQFQVVPTSHLGISFTTLATVYAASSQKGPSVYIHFNMRFMFIGGVPMAVNPVGSGSGPTDGVPPSNINKTQAVPVSFTAFNPNDNENVDFTGWLDTHLSVVSSPNGPTFVTLGTVPNIKGVGHDSGKPHVILAAPLTLVRTFPPDSELDAVTIPAQMSTLEVLYPDFSVFDPGSQRLGYPTIPVDLLVEYSNPLATLVIAISALPTTTP